MCVHPWEKIEEIRICEANRTTKLVITNESHVGRCHDAREHDTWLLLPVFGRVPLTFCLGNVMLYYCRVVFHDRAINVCSNMSLRVRLLWDVRRRIQEHKMAGVTRESAKLEVCRQR